MVMPTRFARLSPVPARALLAALALLVAGGLATALRPAGAGPLLVAAGESDTALYRAIVRDTAEGGGTPAAYYRAAAAEQRARGYPLRPAVTVREPALALLTARAGEGAAFALFEALALAATVLLAARLLAESAQAERIGGTALAAVAVFAMATPTMAVWHEAWAALLLAIAVALAGTRGWPAAVLAGLAAVLVRELAAPVLVVLLLAAVCERRRAEARGWAVALLAFVALFAVHLDMVAGVTRSGDLASPGWARAGGWPFVLLMTGHGSALMLLPRWGDAVAVPLALWGWASRGTRFADRVALALAALIVPFCVIGRPDNFYWGLLFAPILPIGLAFAPRACADLVRAAARQAGPVPPLSRAWTADASS